MIYNINNPVFEALADKLDDFYGYLDEAGYDLACLEAIHTVQTPEGKVRVTFLFDTYFGKQLSVVADKDVDEIVNAVLKEVTNVL